MCGHIHVYRSYHLSCIMHDGDEVCVYLEARGQLCGVGSYYSMGSREQTQDTRLL